MRKQYFIKVFFVYLGFISSSAFSDNFPFEVGERLEYIAKFNFIPAGKAFLNVVSIDTINNQPAFHVQYEARTGPIADRLYKIRDYVDSWLDEKEFFTHKQTKNLRQGNYKFTSKTYIMYDDSIAIVNNDTISIQSRLYDPYSLFYYFRTLELIPGETMDLTVFDNKSLTEFQMIITEKESILVPAGRFNCISVRPFREGKILLKNEGDMTIWFSDDDHKIPIQIKLKIKYGTMVMKLKKINLK